MIDLLRLRENPDFIFERVKKKDPQFAIETLYELDKEVRAVGTTVEALRAEKNELARQGKAVVTEELKQRSRELTRQLKEQEERLLVVTEEFKNLYLRCPNILADDVQPGNKESNKVVRVFGEKPEYSFPLKNHVELGEALGWFDFEAAARITGSNFALYKGDAVRLMYALMMYMFNNNIKHGFSPVLPPYLVSEKSLEGASNFPKFKDDVYSVAADNLYLTPTSEVNLSNMYRDSILSPEQLPIRMTSWTSCFRREAGGYGATERGLIRIHQFEKVELYSITTPDESMNELDRMIACAESIVQALGLHYRISLLAAQDCSFASAKTFDIEVWMPGQKEYKEISSASNCTDFQARRCAIRYRPEAGKPTQLVHTLNASSLALPRLLVALMETYQQEGGSIAIPDVLKTVVVW